MIDIRPLEERGLDDLRRLVTGYVTDARYRITRDESAGRLVLTIERVLLPRPYRKRHDHPDGETLERYRQALACGHSFGAHDQEQCVGITVAEPRAWNRSLWVWELHVAESHRRRRVGWRLVEALAESARAAGLRTMVCETQNTNAPAMDFYRELGIRIEGIDLSYYTNDDFSGGEIAVFMKKSLKE